MTFGAATAGEVLVNRYRLEEHVDTDTAGRQVWRGVDTVLRRPVAVVVRQPGGEAAAGMLTAAVAASRLVHPHLVSVYDAIDEGHRAYVVREWVPGVALRDVLRQGPLDADRSTLVTHAVAEAAAALHAAGIVHGNIHPGTILIADDGRVVLLDAHADGTGDPELDVRAVGAVLYACLTGHWPYAEAGRSKLPDAPRDPHHRPVRARQVRAGVPRHLDEIAAELLDPEVAPPVSGALAAEFARLVATDPEIDDYDQDNYGGYEESRQAGPMGFRGDGGGRRFGGAKIVAGIALLAGIAALGLVVVLKVLPSSSEAAPPGPTQTAVSTTPPTETPIALQPNQVRVVDPPNGERTQSKGIENVVDNDESTGWRTSGYSTASFGGIKPGMGVLIDLGAATKVTEVRVLIAPGGASLSLRKGDTDPGDTSAGDDEIARTYTPLGPAVSDSGTRIVFTVPEDEQTVQHLLIWIDKLPLDSSVTGPYGYRITIDEIQVLTAS
jgi:hypothetical protein